MEKKISYEEALEKIEKIVMEMESGSLALEKTIEKISEKEGELIIDDFEDEI